MKKILSFILAALLPMVANAYDAKIDGIYYNFISENEAEVTASYSTIVNVSYIYHGGISIPTSVTFNGKTYRVTRIGEYAFSGSIDMTSISIPNTVTSIGKYAFYRCSGLTSIKIPNDVTSISDYVFYGCTGLTSFTIPNNVTSIGDYAFSGCSGLTDIQMLTYTSPITSIGRNAFDGCRSLTSFYIPNGLTSIGNGTFRYCTSLTSINIPNNVTSIGDYAFESCSGLTSINIPNSVTSIGQGTYMGCTSLTSIDIPYNVISIGDFAFSGCTNLSSINIPSRLASIGGNAFNGTAWWNNQPDGLVYAGNVAYKYKGTMPENTEITLKEGTTGISGYAFYECPGLATINIPNSVTCIGSLAFCSCNGLTSVTIPEGVTSIGDWAFSYCNSLTSVTIPESVTSIGRFIFEGTPWFDNQPDGLIYAGNVVYAYKGTMPEGTDVEIADGTLGIAGCAFCDCSGLTSITIPNTVISIGEFAFKSCIGLTSIAIPNSVTTIGPKAFEACYFLRDNMINYSGLKDGNNWGAILCDEERSDGLLIANNVAVRCRPWATSVIIPEYVTSIASDDNDVYGHLHGAFIGCSKLTSVTIPESVTSIGKHAFDGCSSLASVTIPNSVKSIGDYAFYNTDANIVIFCNNENPPSTWNNSFSNGTLVIVPENLVDKYKGLWPYHLSINTGFRVANTTQASITLVTPSMLSNQSAWLGQTYYPANDTLKITGLAPNQYYNISTYFEYDGKQYKGKISVNTQRIEMSIRRVESTNVTIKVKAYCNAGDANITESGFEGMGATNEYTLSGLAPGTQHTFTYYVICSDSIRFSKTEKFSTIPLTLSANASPKATSCELTGSYSGVIDATVTGFGFEDYPDHSEVKLTGLDPETAYTKTFYVTTQEGGKTTADVSFTTSPLILTTQQPRVISDGNVIVTATSNLDDDETNVGFEWRRIDWTDDFDSKSGNAYLYDGTMEGYIRSINSNFLWKFRPFYTSNAGNSYYGEWKGMDPSDYSYFEPIVYTYATINLMGTDTGVNAEIKGYAMRGTDRITSQGFMYWKGSAPSSSRMKASSIPSGAQTIEASGNIMTAVLEDLDYDTQYCYVAFVKTEENETFLGEVQTFYMDTPDGIGSVRADVEAIEVGRYDLQGRKIDKPQKGINIIRYSDGTTKKVMIK